MILKTRYQSCSEGLEEGYAGTEVAGGVSRRHSIGRAEALVDGLVVVAAVAETEERRSRRPVERAVELERRAWIEQVILVVAMS